MFLFHPHNCSSMQSDVLLVEVRNYQHATTGMILSHEPLEKLYYHSRHSCSQLQSLHHKFQDYNVNIGHLLQATIKDTDGVGYILSMLIWFHCLSVHRYKEQSLHTFLQLLASFFLPAFFLSHLFFRVISIAVSFLSLIPFIILQDLDKNK